MTWGGAGVGSWRRVLGVIGCASVLASCGGSDDGVEGTDETVALAAPLSDADRRVVDQAIADFVTENRGDPWPALSVLYSSAEAAVLVYAAGDGDPVELCQRFADGCDRRAASERSRAGVARGPHPHPAVVGQAAPGPRSGQEPGLLPTARTAV